MIDQNSHKFVEFVCILMYLLMEESSRYFFNVPSWKISFYIFELADFVRKAIKFQLKHKVTKEHK